MSFKLEPFRAASIKVAEAAKVIENTQRDLNIALMNELSKIFNLMDIDTHEVLKAARTKWNFIDFKPGLVGGHCIGVDPYYLTFKAQALGYEPDVILAGRKINDGMGAFIAHQIVKNLAKKKDEYFNIKGSNFRFHFQRKLSRYQKYKGYRYNFGASRIWASSRC